MQRVVAFTIKRFLLMILIVWAIVTIVFFLAHLSPSDPIGALLGQKLQADPQEYGRLRHLFGLDRPLWQQDPSYLGELLHGRLGDSEQPNTLRPPVGSLLH